MLSIKTLDLRTAKKILFIFSILLYLFSFSTSQAANGAFGWFASKVDYIDTAVPASCGSNEASIDFWLVEEGTKSQLSNSIGAWKVIVRNKSDNTPVNTINVSGQKESPRICFHPVNHGLQVIVYPSSNYHEFTVPTIIPKDVTDDSQTSMQGNHFRGYVELIPKSNPTPTVEAVFPDGDTLSASPIFWVKTNSLTPNYGADQLSGVKIYVVNQTTNNLISEATPTSGGTGTRSIPFSSFLPDGSYFWTFHQELNGSSHTQKFTSPARTWTFDSIPASGAPDAMSFSVDKTGPNIPPPSISITDSTAGFAKVKVSNTITDSLAGLASVEIKVVGGPVVSYTYPAVPKVYSITTNEIFENLAPGDYTFEIQAVDNAGNSSFRTTNFTVPTTFSPPTVQFFSGSYYSLSFTTGIGPFTQTTAWLAGQVTDIATNPLSVTDRRICWSINSADLPDNDSILISSANCLPVSEPSLSSGAFRQYFTNLPPDTTIYFRAIAKNLAGWGFSDLGSFNTPLSPFVLDLTLQTLPTVAFVPPSITTPFYLNPGLSITDSGGSEVSRFGICKAHNPSVLPTEAELLANGPAVAIWCNDMMWNSPVPNWYNGPSPSVRTLSYSSVLPFNVRIDYDGPPNTSGLSPSTTYYFRVYAINSQGIHTEDGLATTPPNSYDFRNAFPPHVTWQASDFNSGTNRFDKITITLGARDFGTVAVPNFRDVPYKLEVDIGNDSSVEYTHIPDNIKAYYHSIIPTIATPSFIKSITINNSGAGFPLGVPIKITSYINEPEHPLYPNISPPDSDRVMSNVITLSNPSSLIDTISAEGGGSGSALILDPNVQLTASPSVVRLGQSTELQWSTRGDVATGSFTCNLTGPSGQIGPSFDPAVTGILSGGRRTGSFTSPSLFNTQIFKVSCDNLANPTDPNSPYTTTTRVTVIGEPYEI